VRCRAVQYDVRRDVYVMMIKLMTPCVKPVYKTAETPPFPHSHPSLEQRHENHHSSIPADEPLWRRPGRDVVGVVLGKHLDPIMLQDHSLPPSLPQLRLRQLPNLTAGAVSSNPPRTRRRLRPLVVVIELVQPTDTSASRRRGAGDVDLAYGSHARARRQWWIPDLVP
jgi:hypothetical protein